MKQVIASVLFLMAAAVVHASTSHTYACKYVSGDLDKDQSVDRVSRRMTLTVSENEATLKGNIWGKDTTDKGSFDAIKNGQYSYAGFGNIQDDNADIRLFVDKELVKATKKSGKMAVWLLGDGEDSVNLRYDYTCTADKK
jgi:hypothetical protein